VKPLVIIWVSIAILAVIIVFLKTHEPTRHTPHLVDLTHQQVIDALQPVSIPYVVPPALLSLQADQLLLADMRKWGMGVEESEKYWQSKLGLHTRLDLHVRAILLAWPAYERWQNSKGSMTPEDAAYMYYASGASGYRAGVSAYWAEVTLLVIDHIDVLSVELED